MVNNNMLFVDEKDLLKYQYDVYACIWAQTVRCTIDILFGGYNIRRDKLGRRNLRGLESNVPSYLA